jgi:hypothetical protein
LSSGKKEFSEENFMFEKKEELFSTDSFSRAKNVRFITRASRTRVLFSSRKYMREKKVLLIFFQTNSLALSALIN